MIHAESIKLDFQEFSFIFANLNQIEQNDYFDSITKNTSQLFKLTILEQNSYLITSVTVIRNVKFFNVHELKGDFGYATYPKQFIELVINMGNFVKADELRIMANRPGAVAMLKKHGFLLKYSEYGINLK